MTRTGAEHTSPARPRRRGIGGGLAVLLLAGIARAEPPSRDTLEAHIDPAIEVYGHWAAVRLPVTRGVPLWNPTTLRFGPDGTAWAANYTGEVYRLRDTDADGLEDTAELFCNVTADGLRHPMTLLPGTNGVLVGTSSELRHYEGTGPTATGSRTVLRLPDSGFGYDWVFGLCRAPDGGVLFALPTDSYNPEPAPDPGRWRGALLHLGPDGQNPEIIASGLRFPYGVAVQPSGTVWFADNEGGGNPFEELNRVEPGRFYGHNPHKYRPANPAQAPLARLTGGRGPAGMAFNPEGNDFDGTAGDLFLTFWGSDGAWADGSLSRMHIGALPDGTPSLREFPVARHFPKPIDVAFSPAGDLYVASYGRGGYNNTPGDAPSGAFYRLAAAPWVTPAAVPRPTVRRRGGDPERGAAVFQRTGCATCHAMDGVSERFGPNLAGLGDHFDQERVLEAIRNPSASIRTGFEGTRIRTRDDGEQTGWVVTADSEQIVLRVAPESDVTLARTNLLGHERMQESLMPAGLIDALPAAELDDLLAYLGIPEPPAKPDPTVVQRFLGWLHHTGPPMRLRNKVALFALAVLAAAAVLTGGALMLLRARKSSR